MVSFETIWDHFGIILGVEFRNDFWHRFGPVWGPSLSPKGEHVQIAWLLKTNVSPKGNGRFGSLGVSNSVHDVRKTKSKRTMWICTIRLLNVGRFREAFWPQKSIQNLTKLNQNSESVLNARSWPQTGLYVFYQEERVSRSESFVFSNKNLPEPYVASRGWRPRRGSRIVRLANYQLVV